MIKKYRKKPLEIEAMQYTGYNAKEIVVWVGNALKCWEDRENSLIYITTLEGDMCGEIGAYIIRGIKGEFYPCKKQIFEDSYEAVNE